MSKRLTEKQKAFCRAYFEHGNGAQAYRETYGRGKKMNPVACRANASRLLTYDNVREYIAELNKQVEGEAVMNKRKRMEWLTRVVRTPAGHVTADSDLCQSCIICEGEQGQKITMPNKLAAISELNKMDGAYTPERVEVRSEFSFASLLEGLPSEPLVKPQQ